MSSVENFRLTACIILTTFELHHEYKIMDISKHISNLLKFQECVIVPDLGGFITNYVPSRFDVGQNIFSPPSKEVIFNSKITRNDGLLVSYLVESEAISYSEANRAVSNWVNHTFENLYNGEKIDLAGVGTLKFDRNGSLVFNPVTENVLASAYGLTDVNFAKASRTVYLDSYQQVPAAVKAINDRKNAIRIAAGIALVISLSLFPAKLKNDNLNFLSSDVNPFTVLKTNSSEDKNTIDAPVGEPVQASPVEAKAKPYILVGGSFESFDNAQIYKNDLVKEGNHAEVLDKKDGLYKVIIDSYNDRETALSSMENYRANHPGSLAWVSTR